MTVVHFNSCGKHIALIKYKGKKINLFYSRKFQQTEDLRKQERKRNKRTNGEKNAQETDFTEDLTCIRY